MAGLMASFLFPEVSSVGSPWVSLAAQPRGAPGSPSMAEARCGRKKSGARSPVPLPTAAVPCTLAPSSCQPCLAICLPVPIPVPLQGLDKGLALADSGLSLVPLLKSVGRSLCSDVHSRVA